jgi:hypothetical protein
LICLFHVYAFGRKTDVFGSMLANSSAKSWRAAMHEAPRHVSSLAANIEPSIVESDIAPGSAASGCWTGAAEPSLQALNGAAQKRNGKRAGQALQSGSADFSTDSRTRGRVVIHDISLQQEINADFPDRRLFSNPRSLPARGATMKAGRCAKHILMICLSPSIGRESNLDNRTRTGLVLWLSCAPTYTLLSFGDLRDTPASPRAARTRSRQSR